MTDFPAPPGGSTPPPPPPPSSQFPPAPPPSLTPPPGYVGYTPSAMSSVPLKRIGGLAKTAVVLAIVGAAVSVLSAIASASVVDDARDYLDGSISEDDFIEAYTAAGGLSFVQVAVMIALAVITIIWMYRIAANHRTLGRVGTWGPGWAVAGWFVPPVLYVIPFLMFRELWKASDPAVPVGSDEWKRGSVSPVVPVWFALYGVAPLVISIAQQANPFELAFGDTESLAEALDEQYTFTVISAIVTAAAAVAFVLLVRGLSARHRRLTGEATTPR